jgi:hypothetical protein
VDLLYGFLTIDREVYMRSGQAGLDGFWKQVQQGLADRVFAASSDEQQQINDRAIAFQATYDDFNDDIQWLWSRISKLRHTLVTSPDQMMWTAILQHIEDMMSATEDMERGRAYDQIMDSVSALLGLLEGLHEDRETLHSVETVQALRARTISLDQIGEQLIKWEMPNSHHMTTANAALPNEKLAYMSARYLHPFRLLCDVCALYLLDDPIRCVPLEAYIEACKQAAINQDMLARYDALLQLDAGTIGQILNALRLIMDDLDSIPFNDAVWLNPLEKPEPSKAPGFGSPIMDILAQGGCVYLDSTETMPLTLFAARLLAQIVLKDAGGRPMVCLYSGAGGDSVETLFRRFHTFDSRQALLIFAAPTPFELSENLPAEGDTTVAAFSQWHRVRNAFHIQAADAPHYDEIMAWMRWAQNDPARSKSLNPLARLGKGDIYYSLDNGTYGKLTP